MERNEDDQEEVERKPKKIPISQIYQIRQPWIILPYGLYYNRELLEAQEGDIILFSDRVEREIEFITPIKMYASYTNFLCRKTYGVGIMRMKERWNVNLEFEGYNLQAINDDRVMLIYLKEIPKQEEPKKKKR